MLTLAESNPNQYQRPTISAIRLTSAGVGCQTLDRQALDRQALKQFGGQPCLETDLTETNKKFKVSRLLPKCQILGAKNGCHMLVDAS